MADKKIDQDKPNETLCVEFVQTDTLILPFTKPEGVNFLPEPVAFIVERTDEESTVKKLTLGQGLQIDENVLTLTLKGEDFKCYVGNELFVIMQVINQGKRDVIFKMLVKYAPE